MEEYSKSNNILYVVIFVVLLVGALFLIVSVSNSTYSLDLGSGESCPGGFVHSDDSQFKCEKTTTFTTSDIDKLNQLCNDCEDNYDGACDTYKFSPTYSRFTCYTNKVTTDGGGSQRKVTLNANNGTFWNDQLASGTHTLTINTTYDANEMKDELVLTYDTGKYSLQRTGYKFKGWSTAAGTNGLCTPTYQTGATILGPVGTYYACWEKNSSGEKPVINCSSTSIGLWCTDSNTNGDVSQLQSKLKYLGYYTGEVDGSAGLGTISAIKKFQQQEGLTVDGNAGPATLERLRLRYNEKIQDNSDTETPPDEEEIPANALTYYNLKYDTNGGSFANEDKIRTMVVSNEAIIEEPPYNPTREGYKFDGWYTSSGQKFTFNKALTSDTTLIAKWVTIDNENSCTYSCNPGDVFDPSTNKCISVEKFDNEKNLISIVNYSRTCSNGTSWFNNYECTGNCNKKDCSSGYTNNFWHEKNDCYFGSSCGKITADECSITMKRECYKTYEANKNCEDDSQNSNDNDVINPQTGNTLIIIVWVVGISALVYAIYYYNKNKKLN